MKKFKDLTPTLNYVPLLITGSSGTEESMLLHIREDGFLAQGFSPMFVGKDLPADFDTSAIEGKDFDEIPDAIIEAHALHIDHARVKVKFPDKYEDKIRDFMSDEAKAERAAKREAERNREVKPLVVSDFEAQQIANEEESAFVEDRHYEEAERRAVRRLSKSSKRNEPHEHPE